MKMEKREELKRRKFIIKSFIFVIFIVIAVFQTVGDEVIVCGEPLYETGYMIQDVPVYETPDTSAAVVGISSINSRVYYCHDCEEGWNRLANGGYIQAGNISDTYNEDIVVSYDIPANTGKKSWMGCNLFGAGTRQAALQQMAMTDENGLRTVNGRYCVAIGSHFGTSIGQCFDLILMDGTRIPCVMGDQKADCHTDAQNIFTGNGCCSEFIVEQSALNPAAKQSGSVSSINGWNSPVMKILVYDINIINE